MSTLRPMAAPTRPGKTAADYIAMAFAPALVFGMVGSLTQFLVEVGYGGAFKGQVRWTLFWFSLASVAVSRISIQHGRWAGRAYGLALGLATGFRLVSLIGFQVVPLALIGAIWWCASRLTWDCTLIDEDEDASGEGLLQRAGFGRGPGSSEDVPESSGGRETRPDEPHAPGVWIVRFSLGALPLFALGQLALPAAAEARRHFGFAMLWCYVACGVGLLLMTSFLGLRRYLRQRYLTMPPAMARSWFVSGGSAALAALALSLLLPRPEGPETLLALAGRVRPKAQQASHAAWTGGDAAQGAGRELGRGDAGHPAAGPERGGGRGPTGEGRPEEGAGRDLAGGEEGVGGRGGDASGTEPTGAEDRRSGASGSGGIDAPSVSAPPFDPGWLRALLWIAGLAALLFLAARFGPELLNAWRRRSGRTPAPAAATPARSAERERRFAEYPDPFRSGLVARMSAADLAVYTFHALQAWARERGRARRPDQTPAEFAESVAGDLAHVSDELFAAVRWYAGVAYAGAPPGPDCAGTLERLWQGLSG